jgi:hypothetical protein
MAGWQRAGQVQFYSPDTLFDAIDGAADLFLAYGFKTLQVAQYKSGEKASVLVEVYAHGNPLQAFGVYSQERMPEAQYFSAGAQAYLDEGASFAGLVKGSHYVKISGHNLGTNKAQVLTEFALKMAHLLPGEAKLPGLLSVFPSEGKLTNSELYIDQNVLGYDFFKVGFTAEYEVGGQRFRLFVLDGGDRAGAEGMLRDYLAKLGQKLEETSPGPLSLNDPNHGPLALALRGRYLAGVLNQSDQALRLRYLMALAEEISKASD